MRRDRWSRRSPRAAKTRHELRRAIAARARARRARCASLMPSMERVRFVSSGTEAAMSAIRVARAFTGRDRIIKFEGCYHGHADAFLVKAGSGAMTLGIPTSPGVPAPWPPTRCSRATTIWRPSMRCSRASRRIDRRHHRRADRRQHRCRATGRRLPRRPARALHAHGILLIFDEVISGFRAAAGGAQAMFGIQPDLTCLGKIIGGGLPVGAYGGRADIMSWWRRRVRCIRRARCREIPSR